MTFPPSDYPRWEAYALPSFQNGSNRRQPVPFKTIRALVGSHFYNTVTSNLNNLPVAWDVSLILDKDQAERFELLMREIENAGNWTFAKMMVTENGINDHDLTIVGGTPQGVHFAFNKWRYNFTVVSDRLNRDITPLPPEIEFVPVGDSYINPLTWAEQPPLGLNSGGIENITSIATQRGTSTIIASFWDGYTSMSFDDGRTWEQKERHLNSGATGSMFSQASVISRDGQKAFVSFGGFMAWTTNGGDSFLPYPVQEVMDQGGLAISSIAMNPSGQRVMVFFILGAAFLSTDGGSNFSAMVKGLNSGDVNASIIDSCISENGLIAYAILTGGRICRTDNGGQTWTALQRWANSGGEAEATCVDCSTDGNVLAIGFSDGRASFSNNRGNTFTALPRHVGTSAINSAILDVKLSNTGLKAVFGLEDGFASVTLDRFGSFSQLPNGLNASPDQNINIVESNGVTWFGAVTERLAVSGYDPVPPGPEYPTPREPQIWQNVPPRYQSSGSSSAGNTFCAMSTDGQIAFYVQTSGFASLSTDGMNTFSPMPVGLGTGLSLTPFCTCMGGDGQRIYVAWADAYASRSVDGGQTWEEMIRGLNSGTVTANTRSIACSEDGLTVIAGFQDASVSISYNGGDTWIQLEQGLGSGAGNILALTSSMSDDGQTIFVGFYNGFSSISYDAGATWTANPQGLGNPGSTSNLISSCMSKDGQVIFVGTANGNVSRSIDGGQNWDLMPQGINSGVVSETIFQLRCSFDGSVVMGTVGVAYAAYSPDTGNTWIELPRQLDTGSNVTFTGLATNGREWYATQFGGRASKSV